MMDAQNGKNEMDVYSGGSKGKEGEEGGERKVREQSQERRMEGRAGHREGIENEIDGSDGRIKRKEEGGWRRDEQRAAVKHESSRTQFTLLLNLQ